MYKEGKGGHNRSSTKEKRNTYPPLFNTLSADLVGRRGIFLRKALFYQENRMFYELQFIA